MPTARIASLLPSSTEILFALGLGPRVVAVSHECDHPQSAHGLPVVTFSKIDSTKDSRDIDLQVRNLIQTGLSLYGIKEDTLAAAKPDLIVTQDTCKVCAVSFDEVCAAAQKRFGGSTRVLSLSPRNLADVFEDLRRVAQAADVDEKPLIASLQARLDNLRKRLVGKPRPRVLALEWLDPPMIAGHWTPELIEIAGGECVLGHRGEPTKTEPWSRITDCRADVILIIPCGFKIDQTRRELAAFLKRPELQGLPAMKNGRVWVADGNAYFNRPGPRLIESAEIAAAAIHGLKFDWLTSDDLQKTSDDLQKA